MSGILEYDEAMDEKIGQALRNARSRLGWSQRTLARYVEITPAYVALIEQGLRNPGAELRSRLDKLFAGFDVATQFGLSGRGAATSQRSTQAWPTDYQGVEFSLPVPDDIDWFNRTPLTMVVGPIGSGKTTYVRRWLSAMSRRSGKKVVWVTLAMHPSALQGIEWQIRSQVALDREERAPATPPSNASSLAQSIARRLESSARASFVVCFDDWVPSEGGAHDVVLSLAAALQRTPVVAMTESPRSGLAGSVAVPVPAPGATEWSAWCERWQLPRSLQATFFDTTRHNILAASYLKGAALFAASASASADVGEAWSNVLHGLPRDPVVAWHALVDRCMATIGDRASQVLQTSAAALNPIPSGFFQDEEESGLVSRLIECRLVQTDGGGLTVHPVMRRFAEAPTQEYVRAHINAQAESPASVELLLRLEQYDEAADCIVLAVDRWQKQAEAPAQIISWADRLPPELINERPQLQLGIARACAVRASLGDLSRAAALLGGMLENASTPESLRWKALQQSADIAIRLCDYLSAGRYIDLAEKLAGGSAGVFDQEALDVLRARVAWEQCAFQSALAAIDTPTVPVTSHGARRLSWQARSLAALGRYADATAAAQKGLEIAKAIDSERSEAYASVLLADYEALRGNLGRAARLAERATRIGRKLGYVSLEVQGLGVEAEILLARGEHQGATKLLEQARDVLTERAEDSWANAYLLITESRLCRAQPRWPALWSKAQQLARESEILRARAPHHPVVSALVVEAAHCWVASGYAHEAAKVLATLTSEACDWRSWWEARLLSAITDVSEGEERIHVVRHLLDEAREAGCPYLAALGGYLAASYALLRGDFDAVANLATWTSQVSASRGWSVLASLAEALAPAREPAEPSTPQRVIAADGSVTVLVPRRGQPGAARGSVTELPDPFED